MGSRAQMGPHKGPRGLHGLEGDTGSYGEMPGRPSGLSAHLPPAEQCNSEEVCAMSWYTPMPMKNGSVVMHVDVSSNGLGPFIHNKRCPFPSGDSGYTLGGAS